MLVIYNDTGPGRWGMQLHLAARARGMPNMLLGHTRTEPEPGESLYFCRPEQLTPSKVMPWVLGRSCKGVQHVHEVIEYERKDLQHAAYRDYMPLSVRVNTPEGLLASYKKMFSHPTNGGHFTPCVLKLPHGSSSRNVFLLDSLECLNAYARHLNRLPPGHHALLQQRIPNLAGVWRATRVGSGAWLYFNHNREHEAKASGSGLYTPVSEAMQLQQNPVARKVWAFAWDFWKAHGMRWGGLDIAVHPDGTPYLLETTLAWGYHVRGAHWDSVIMNESGQEQYTSGLLAYGRCQWSWLLDCIERGEFA